jgi:hypothetical protein
MPQLTNNESRGFTHGLKITSTDLNATGYLTSSQKIIGYIPAGGIVTNCAVVVNTAAVGATNITLAVGTTSGTATELIASTDLDALTKVAYNTGTAVDTEPGLVNNTASAVAIYALFGGTIANLTAGEWLIAYTLLDPANLVNNA